MAVSRLGLTSREFYQLTPVEFHHAIIDHEKIHFTPMKRICELLRMNGVTIHNSAFGRKKSDKIKNPAEYVEFTWERPKVQTVEDMKSFVLGLSHIKGVKVTQKGKKVR